MIKVMAFSLLARHFAGEVYAPVDVGGLFELRSADRVLVGSNGNAYKFKSAENAAFWLESQSIKVIKQSMTAQSVIDALEFKKLSAPSAWLDEEIATLNARNAGQWNNSYFTDEWAVIAKGDKGDKGDTGEAGAAGADGVSAGALVKGNLIEFLMPTTAARQQISAHGLQGEPDFWQSYYQCINARAGYVVGDKVFAAEGIFGANEKIAIVFDGVNFTINQAALANFYVLNKTTRALTIAGSDCAYFKLCIQPFKWVGVGG